MQKVLLLFISLAFFVEVDAAEKPEFTAEEKQSETKTSDANPASETKDAEESATTEPGIKLSSDAPQAGTSESQAAIKAQAESLLQKLQEVKLKPEDMFDSQAGNSWWQSLLEETAKTKKTFEGLLEEVEEALADGSELERVEWWRDAKNLATGIEAEAGVSDRFKAASEKVAELKKLPREKITAAIENLEEIQTEVLQNLKKINSQMSSAV